MLATKQRIIETRARNTELQLYCQVIMPNFFREIFFQKETKTPLQSVFCIWYLLTSEQSPAYKYTSNNGSKLHSHMARIAPA